MFLQMIFEGAFQIRPAYIGEQSFRYVVRHHISLRQIAERGTELAVRTAVLCNNNICQAGIGVFNIYREL